MRTNINSEKIVSIIWNYIEYYRGVASIQDIFPSVLYILYGIHKKYTAVRIPNGHLFFQEDKDALLNDIFRFIDKKGDSFFLYDLYQELSKIDSDVYDEYYSMVLGVLNHKVSSLSGKKDGDFFTPEAINILLSLFINGQGCKSIYDPFCGTASLIHWLDAENNDLQYRGQDYNLLASLIARVNVDSRLGTDGCIRCTDSISDWDASLYDAVVSCPPLNLKINNENTVYRSCEEIFFSRALDINKAKVVACLTSTGFSFRSGNERMTRMDLVERNLLDTIVSLPANILYGTSVPCILFVCKSSRPKDEPIKYIHAENYYLGNTKQKRKFDIVRFISSMESNEDGFCVNVSLDDIRHFDYNLNPALYIDKNFKLSEGQEIVSLKDLLHLEEGVRAEGVPNARTFIPARMATNYIRILLNKNVTENLNDSREGFRYRLYAPEGGKSYLIVSEIGGDMRFALYDDSEPFYCNTSIKVFSINDSIINPDYLVYLLANHSTIATSRMSIKAFAYFPLVIDSKANQLQIIGRILRQHADKVKAEHEANERRLGIKTNISDLEHMLGSTQMKINNIIERLTTIKPDNEQYPETVKQLKDNVEYMNRIIHYTNASIDKESFNKKEYDFMSYLEDYLSAWANYGGNYFRLTVSNDIDGKISLLFDKALMTVMLDSVLSNAVRHGFHKRKNFTVDNQVNIGLSMENYKNKPYLVVRIANNGEPISDDFTIDDYITRGRYSANTGRSGLGGYHVFQIVKGHHGFLSLDSNKVWNVIVEILLPIDNVELNGLIDYEHECI